MQLHRVTHLFVLCVSYALMAAYELPAQTVPAHLPGELSADDVLNGKYPYPPSPKMDVHDDFAGFAQDRLTKVPAPGVHPRLLLSPEDLPALRQRLATTETGQRLNKRLHERLHDAIGKPGSWGYRTYAALSSGDIATSVKLMNEPNHPTSVGHYQPYILYSLTMESFDAMLTGDRARGKKVAMAIATWSKIVDPIIDQIDTQPMYDDVFRAFAAKKNDGSWSDGISIRDLAGYHLLGYCYDFAYNFMTPAERDTTRGVISRITSGRVWMGARLPHHFRNWNWVAIGLSQPLLALSIEGEPGYDPRVYKLGVEIARDYLTYGIDASGESTEAVGYTNFGLVWATPFWVAAARRGENFLADSHNRNMIPWYLQSEEPSGMVWQSHGDGGDSGPSLWNLSMWKYFYPNDPRVDSLFQSVLWTDHKDKLANTTDHIIEPLIFASDPMKDKNGKLVDYSDKTRLGEPLTFFDPIRSSLNARSAWTSDATEIEFECRTDSVDASHEHADRGNFTLSAMGRQWAKESFRSVESRYHNVVLIDGMGQGYWPGPGRWLGEQDAGWAVMAASDAKAAYDNWWPKRVVTESPDWVRYQYSRWQGFLPQEKEFELAYGNVTSHLDQRPSVVEHFKGFGAGDPRMWDEDTWPLAFPHNPVERAFRTLTFARGSHPYMLVADDIQKDDKERLYEWIMMTGINTEVVSIKNNDVILADATAPRDEEGVVRPRRGDRELLVRVLDMSDPVKPGDYQSRPNFRLETFEKKDTNSIDGRSFGEDKRLIIASRSITPRFKILLLPIHAGDPLPVTTWNKEHSRLSIAFKDYTDSYDFTLNSDGRTRVTVKRPGESALTLP